MGGCRTIWPMGAELPKPEKLRSLWDDDNYVAEIKIDGERVTVVFTEKGVRVFTRSGSKFNPSRPIEITHRWAQAQILSTSPGIPEGTVLDGEAFSPVRRAEEVAGLLNYRSKVPVPDDIRFIVFDCVLWGNQSLEHDPWMIRRDYVERAVELISDKFISPAAVTHQRKREFYTRITEKGGEGVVLKNVYGPYIQGKKPAGLWVKAKKHDTYDCIITGFKPGEGKFKGMVGSVELSQYKDTGKECILVKVCHAGQLADELRMDMTQQPGYYIGRVVVVDAYERVPGSAALKHPRIKFLRPEGSKDPKDCLIED